MLLCRDGAEAPGGHPKRRARRGERRKPGAGVRETASVDEFHSTITPVLTVRYAAQAVVFYERAFGAEEIYRNTYPDGRIGRGPKKSRSFGPVIREPPGCL